ncbi:MAG: hypothetical protein HIU83_02750 [Proteobacteria bacterium]|nr:hypothetical protein [Pseudomonadota bacterium]
MSCDECHTIFPELTPFGRIFKLGGYVLSKSGTQYEFPPPLAGMVQASFTDAKGLTSGVAPFDSTNRATDKINIPQQVSLFYGGRIYDSLGAFVQGTYDGVSDKFFLDLTDIRYSRNTIVMGKNLIYGLTLNNSPTVQDVWNTTPVWGFPSASSSVAATPAAGTIIDGALGQQVGGIGAYAYWNNLLYLEGTVYRTARNGITKPLGAGTATDQVVDGAAPYWRLALEQRWKNHFFTVGTYGMQADIFPSGTSSGPADRFTDVAFDAQYQFMGTIAAEQMQEHMQMDGGHMAGAGKHIITAHATWTHESQEWKASFPLGNTANSSDFLNTFRMNLNYYYKSHVGDIGGSIAYFSTIGKTDNLLYSPASVGGSRTGSPNSNGFTLEADYVPWEQTKISLQYTIYDKFNGAHSNYDGFGRNASDNNTLYALVWLMF